MLLFHPYNFSYNGPRHSLSAAHAAAHAAIYIAVIINNHTPFLKLAIVRTAVIKLRLELFLQLFIATALTLTSTVPNYLAHKIIIL